MKSLFPALLSALLLLAAANAAAGAALGYRTFCPRSNSDWREEVRRILGAGV